MSQRSSHAALLAAALVAGSGLPTSRQLVLPRKKREKREREKKRPHSGVDSARLRKAELKRRRKAEKRNRDRAVIIGAPAADKPVRHVGTWKRRKILGRALKALLREGAS